MELSRRRREAPLKRLNKINSSLSVFELMHPLLGHLAYEEFWVLYLNNSNKILAKTHTSKMARKVHKFMHSQSVNRGQFGLARAPPQGRAPPRPNEEQKIALVPGAVRVKSEKALPVMKTPEPPFASMCIQSTWICTQLGDIYKILLVARITG